MPEFGWLTERPVAHRGFHDRAAGRIENSLSAARAAVDRGFAVECDVHLSGDGEVVVFHDTTLDRLTGATGAVRDRSLAELQAIRLSGSDDRIPTLAELCAVVAGHMPLFVEIKSAGSGEPELVRRVAATLAQFSGAFAVMSFDPRVLRRMRPLAPDLPLGMIADRFDGPGARSMSPFNRFALRHLLPAPFVRPDFVSYGIHALPANAPLLLRHFGLPLLTWTVRTQDQQQTAKRYADQMTFEGFDPRATGTAREQSA